MSTAESGPAPRRVPSLRSRSRVVMEPLFLQSWFANTAGETGLALQGLQKSGCWDRSGLDTVKSAPPPSQSLAVRPCCFSLSLSTREMAPGWRGGSHLSGEETELWQGAWGLRSETWRGSLLPTQHIRGSHRPPSPAARTYPCSVGGGGFQGCSRARVNKLGPPKRRRY